MVAITEMYIKAIQNEDVMASILSLPILEQGNDSAMSLDQDAPGPLMALCKVFVSCLAIKSSVLLLFVCFALTVYYITGICLRMANKDTYIQTLSPNSCL